MSKRSEMVKIMTRSWKEYTKGLTKDFNGVDYGMSIVLDAIEEAGMLPPNHNLSRESLEDYLNLVGCSVEWEPEDES